jgi:hypothetical protein
MNHRQTYAQRRGRTTGALNLPSKRKHRQLPINPAKVGKTLGRIFVGMIVAIGIYLFVVIPTLDLNRYLDWIEQQVQRKTGGR